MFLVTLSLCEPFGQTVWANRLGKPFGRTVWANRLGDSHGFITHKPWLFSKQLTLHAPKSGDFGYPRQPNSPTTNATFVVHHHDQFLDRPKDRCQRKAPF